MASPTRWTSVWVNSGSWWWTGRPGVLQFMGSQRVRHDWVTELNWTHGAFIPSFFKESPYHLPQWLYQFIFPPTVQECSLLSTPSSAFIVYRLFDDGHSDLCGVILHCSFDLHFSDNEQYWASFHVFISHMYAFFGELSAWTSAYFFQNYLIYFNWRIIIILWWFLICVNLNWPAYLLIGLFVFLILSYTSCLHILEVSPLSLVSFAIIFSHSERCLFTFLVHCWIELMIIGIFVSFLISEVKFSTFYQ